MSESKPIPDLVWVDCETTGLDPATSEVIEVAAIRLDAKTLEEKAFVHRYIMPTGPITDEAAKVNGYTPELWREREAGTFVSVVPDLNPVLAGATPAGQNPDFDMRHIKEAYRREGTEMPKMDYHLIDLASLVWPLQLAGLIPSVSLRYTAPFFGLGEQTHGALDDIRKTIAVYKKVLGLYMPVLAALATKQLQSGPPERELVQLRMPEVAETQLHRLARALNKSGESILEEAVGLLALSVDAVNEGRELAIVDSDGVMISRVKLEIGNKKTKKQKEG